MDFTEYAAIPAVVIIVYLAMEIYKVFAKGETALKAIPPLCGVLGLLLGIGCFYFLPGVIPADNILAAAAMGIVSGFAATGVNQVVKQATK